MGKNRKKRRDSIISAYFLAASQLGNFSPAQVRQAARAISA
jgi:hypothetical protein